MPTELAAAALPEISRLNSSTTAAIATWVDKQPLPASARQAVSSFRKKRWGVVLAGGEGSRLNPLTSLIYGYDRPKQFCSLIGGKTLLTQTRLRAEKAIRSEQILYVLLRNHREFYLEESALAPAQRIVQPSNKGTAPAIAYSLLSIEKTDKDAVAAILPSDHHYTNERAFRVALESAFEIAECCTDAVVLLGVHPDGPEMEFGWIEVSSRSNRQEGSICHVHGFCEKPSFQTALRLFQKGSLLNTFVLVGRVSNFLAIIKAAQSDLLASLAATPLWSGAEEHIPDSTYERFESTDFCRSILSVQARRLIALQTSATGWSDLGRPERVLQVMQASGLEAWWADAWAASKKTGAAFVPRTVAALD